MCDIVMKGGITSGVVYPGAIVSLAKRYRFRSIGGTSAGAIAAAILGAAEHARRGPIPGDAGFRLIEALPDKLGQDGFMLQLFQADRSTRPLFDAATAFMSKRRLLGVRRLVVALWRTSLAAGAVFCTSLLVCLTGGADWAYGVAGIAASLVIMAIGVVAEGLRFVRAISGNDFGICRLGPAVGTSAKPALTGWLHEQIQAAAMRGAGEGPVTFADLWGVRTATGPASGDLDRLGDLCDCSYRPDCREVDLQMITTDLTQGRPMRLPAVYDRHRGELEDGAEYLLFDRYELRRFFPPAGLAHLVMCAEPLRDPALRAIADAKEPDLFDPDSLEPALRGAAWTDSEGTQRLLRLPIGPDLPVVVATRMSLSFPILIASVPLWRLAREADDVFRVRRVRFSDGGITSNFPIHFFDSPLPRWPTFGLDLTSPDLGETLDPDVAAAWVEAPLAPGEPARERTREINGIGGFVVALKDAAQNWRDNSQARLPGFRDRIAHIKLATGEGGLNLAMKPCAIKRLNDRGTVAGEALRTKFSGAGEEPASLTAHWDDHRFARYRVTMAVMQRLLRDYAVGYDTPAPGDDITPRYEERLARGEQAPPFAFGTPERLADALESSECYVGLGERATDLDDAGVPRPPATMRTVPPA